MAARFKEVGTQADDGNPIVIAKFFNPCGSGTWLATAYYPEQNICFGYVKGIVSGGDEWGYFSIDELESITCPPLGIRIERDIHFKECLFSHFKIGGLV